MSSEDNRIDEYLWDPGATPDPDVQAIERRLEGVRFDAARHPIVFPPLPSRLPARRTASLRTTFALAAAAAVVLAVGIAAWWSWRWTWTPGASWATEIDSVSQPAPGIRTALAVDKPLQLPPTNSARVNIARIGTMRVAPGSAITLAETTSVRHRVVLDRGAVSVRIFAPPGMFAFGTPSGTVRDLGCIFDLAVDRDGTARLRVDTGWVQMDNDFGESLIPAGASASMHRLLRPGVPIYDDASDAFARAVRSAQDGGDAAEQSELETILGTARRRDVLTLLMLAKDSRTDLRRRLLLRAAELWPPPSGVSVESIVAGDRDPLWQWHAALDLPPLKSWWRNWRDALPWRQ